MPPSFDWTKEVPGLPRGQVKANAFIEIYCIPGSVAVRQGEDLERGALTCAEIKAIASGNPAAE